MVILITGASHTGKTLLAQKFVEKYGYPCLSIDLLKMGLIRSGYTALTPEDDDARTDYLWPVVREMMKTAIENGQNLIIEGCYIPFDWKTQFSDDYLKEIQDCCLVMSAHYIEQHFSEIKQYANVIEQRQDDTQCTIDFVRADNARYLKMCRTYNCTYLLIDAVYRVGIDESGRCVLS